MKKNKISYRECIQIYNIEENFLQELQKSGLVKTSEENNEIFIEYSKIENFERYIRLYYDLEINMPGIEAIHHILKRVDELQKNIKLLNEEIKMFKALYGSLSDEEIE